MLARRALTIATLASTLTAIIAVPAQAASYAWHSHRYSVKFVKNSSPLSACVTVEAYGTIRFYSRTVPNYNEIIVKKVELKNPTMFIAANNNCGWQGTGKTLSSASLSQTWYGYHCSNSWSYSVGTGWFAGVGVTRTCGKVKRAGRSTHYAVHAVGYSQYNSGYPVVWRTNDVIAQKKGKICARLDLETTIYLGSSSDTLAQTFKPCVLGH
jgi:hypothetical protein